jgi:hypothetical protein
MSHGAMPARTRRQEADTPAAAAVAMATARTWVCGDPDAVERELLPQLRPHRESPAVHVAGVDARARGQRNPAALAGAVAPQLERRAVGHHAGRDGVGSEVDIETRVGQARRERGERARRWLGAVAIALEHLAAGGE